MGKLLQNYKKLEMWNFQDTLKHISDHLSVLIRFGWLSLKTISKMVIQYNLKELVESFVRFQ